MASEGDSLSMESAQGFGIPQATGELEVLLQEQTHPGQGFGDPVFYLNASRVIVTTDVTDFMFDAGVRVSTVVESSEQEFNEVEIQGFDHRFDYRFSLWPDDAGASVVMADRNCLSVESSAQAEVVRNAIVDDSRTPEKARVDNAVAGSSCGRATSLAIQGDFLLRLWEWDAELSSNEDSKTLESGKSNPADGPVKARNAGRAQEQFIHVMNGTLTIPRLEGVYDLYMTEATLSASTAIKAERVTGSLLGVAVEDQDLFVRGGDLALSLVATKVAEPLDASLSGDVHEVTLDGISIPLGSIMNDPGPTTFNGPGLAGLMAVLVVASAGAAAWRASPQLRARVRVAHMRAREMKFEEALAEANDFSMDRPRRSYRWAKKALKLRPNHPEALAAMGRSFLGRRRYEAAYSSFRDAIFSIYAQKPPEADMDIVAFWAKDAAHCLGRIRFLVDKEERESLAEIILDYSRVAWNADPSVAWELLKDGTISDLWENLEVMFSLGRHGVHA